MASSDQVGRYLSAAPNGIRWPRWRCSSRWLRMARRKCTREDLRPVDHRRIVGHGSVLNIFIQKEWDQLPTSLIMRRACRRVPSGDRNRSHCFSVFNVMRHLPLFFFSHGAGNGLDLLMISFQEKKLEIAASLQEHGRWQRIFVLILFFHDLPISGGADGKVGWNGRGTAKLR